MKHPRDIDMELVDAYLARRALDYLVGFTLSPVLWRKLPGARSAGRVQSVALRLIVDREIEIEAFRTQEYWSVEADVSAGGDPFLARLVKHEGKRLDQVRPGQRGRRAMAAKAAVEAGALQGRARSRRSPARRSPPPPFTTSTLQQEAVAQARLLGPAHHAGGPAALRGRRHRRRDRRPDHLHAHRRRAGGAGGAGRGARGDRRPLRQGLRAGRAAPLQGQGQERPGGARGDPARPAWRAIPARCAWSPTSAGSTS